MVAETGGERPLPVAVGRLVVQVVLEREPLEREPEHPELLERRGLRGRVHVVRVQRQRQVQFPQSLATGQHVQHAGRRRLDALGQVQPEPLQLPKLAHPAQRVVRHVRALAQAQRLQPVGFLETCGHTEPYENVKANAANGPKR